MVIYKGRQEVRKTNERKETPQERYDKTNTCKVSLKLNKKTDSKIISKLASVQNKQGYIKDLINQDISKEQNKQN